MLDYVLHTTEFFNSFFPGLHGAVRDDFFKIVEILAFAKALTAIGAAYTKRMIPLRTIAMLKQLSRRRCQHRHRQSFHFCRTCRESSAQRDAIEGDAPSRG
jgi:hypothetical protein